jgi:Hypervirulence associated proteins TUDOR domain
MAIRRGTTVSWAWGRSRAEGKVTAIHRETVTRTINGSTITRHGSRDDPAYEIEQGDGSRVLKLRSEVRPAG